MVDVVAALGTALTSKRYRVLMPGCETLCISGLDDVWYTESSFVTVDSLTIMRQ